MFIFSKTAIAASLFALTANAHLVAFDPAVYCLDGPVRGVVDLNTYSIVYPLYQLVFSKWWFHAVDGCNQFPPPDGTFLDLPAGGSFTVEIASNRAKTSLSYNGQYTSDWPDGATYPEDYNVPTCITSPNMHTQNQSRAAGTAFAISYQSDINLVTPDNLVVFSVRYNTPWKRITTYDVPQNMPACPPDGCICAWGWVPNGCGQPNMYHVPYKCRVTNAQSTTPVGTPKPPVWCEGNPDACTKGPKQMIYWNQLEGNNIEVSGSDLNGDPKSPPYNMKLGFLDGAQDDIFAGPPSSGSTPSPASSPSPNPTPSTVASTTATATATATQANAGSPGAPVVLIPIPASPGTTPAASTPAPAGSTPAASTPDDPAAPMPADSTPVGTTPAGPGGPGAPVAGGAPPPAASDDSTVQSSPPTASRRRCKPRGLSSKREELGEAALVKRALGGHHRLKNRMF